MFTSTGELYKIKMDYIDGYSIDWGDEKNTQKRVQVQDKARQEFIANQEQNLEKVKLLISQSGFTSDPISSINYENTGFNLGSNRPFHNFKVTTSTNKQYTFKIYNDLTQFMEVYTDAYLKLVNYNSDVR